MLNVSGNRLDTLEDLGVLSELQQLIANDNDISSMKVSLIDLPERERETKEHCRKFLGCISNSKMKVTASIVHNY